MGIYDLPERIETEDEYFELMDLSEKLMDLLEEFDERYYDFILEVEDEKE